MVFLGEQYGDTAAIVTAMICLSGIGVIAQLDWMLTKGEAELRDGDPQNPWDTHIK
jgi:hypothetical protein